MARQGKVCPTTKLKIIVHLINFLLHGTKAVILQLVECNRHMPGLHFYLRSGLLNEMFVRLSWPKPVMEREGRPSPGSG